MLTEEQWQSMRDDTIQRKPEEACGLLGGKANRVFDVIPVTNILRSNVRYRMDPAEQLQAFQRFEEKGLEISGIYHSHPEGTARPSQTDLEEAYYPEAVYIIWAEEYDGWNCRAYRIDGDLFREVEILIVPQ